jgi:hypothetical protein
MLVAGVKAKGMNESGFEISNASSHDRVASDTVTVGRLGLNPEQLRPVDFPNTISVSRANVTSKKA